MLFVDVTWRVVDDDIKPYMVFWNPESTKIDLQILEQNEHISWTIDGQLMVQRCVSDTGITRGTIYHVLKK